LQRRKLLYFSFALYRIVKDSVLYLISLEFSWKNNENSFNLQSTEFYRLLRVKNGIAENNFVWIISNII